MYRSIAASVFISTALLKEVSLAYNETLLNLPDEVLFVPQRFVLAVAIVVELICLFLIWYLRSDKHVARVVLCFIVPASLYRLAGTFLGISHCPCLGSLTGWWPWLAAHQTAVLNTIAAWMFVSAVMVLVRNPSVGQTSKGVVAA